MKKNDLEYILMNSNFMKWILSKLSDNYYIDDHDVKFMENDLDNLKKIKYLYNLVNDYALYNSIQPTRFMNYNLYYIEYEGMVFFVYEGVNSYGCFNNTLDRKSILSSVINFEDVRRFKMEELLSQEDNMFSGLKNEIVKLYNKDISVELISQVVNRLLCEVKNEDKGHVYKKI